MSHATATFNNFKNWETWNIALWISNDEGLYKFAKGFCNYRTFAECLLEKSTFISTPDGADFLSNALDYNKLDEIIYDL